MGEVSHFLDMSEEQLSALLAKLKEDAGLQGKLKGAADLDAAVALLEEAGFDVSKADLLRYQAKQALELSDEDLEGIAGGCLALLTGGGLGKTASVFQMCDTNTHPMKAPY
jgi:predicted ribosomally synthesized peptide with nif11-like leader